MEERRANERRSEAAAGVKGPAVPRGDAPLFGSVLNSWAITTLLRETVGEVYTTTPFLFSFEGFLFSLYYIQNRLFNRARTTAGTVCRAPLHA
jgi:hypothetical protein